MRYLKIMILLNLVYFFGCQNPENFQPDFNNKKVQVLNEIKAQYNFKDITFAKEKQSANGKSYYSLIVKFIDGKDLPTNAATLAQKTKQLGIQVRSILKNPAEFDTYNILFVIRITTPQDTHENHLGQEYRLDELK